MATLGLVLQEEFTEAVKQSWIVVFKLMSNIMVRYKTREWGEQVRGGGWAQRQCGSHAVQAVSHDFSSRALVPSFVSCASFSTWSLFRRSPASLSLWFPVRFCRVDRRAESRLFYAPLLC